MNRLVPVRRRRPALHQTALAVAAVLLAGSAWADPPARVGRVAWVAGDVSLATEPGAAPGSAALNWPVTTGNVLSTGPSGRAEVTIGSTAIDLDVGTEVDVEQLDDAQMRLRVMRGSVAVRVSDPQDATMLVVQTPLGRFTEPQPAQLRVDVNGPSVDGTAWRGNVNFTADSGASYTFTQGQHARLGQAGSGLSMQLLDARPDDFQHFVQARAGARPVVAASRYVSPAMTGADTLDSYGQWTSSPDYGAVWVPQVSADWAPYRYGHWSWVSPWGWTWVDDAPWGFAPFHYGRWAMWQGRWAWVPGTYVARPVYAPALVAWTSAVPAAPGVSLSISVGSNVGWVPLASREVYVPPYTVSNTYVRNVNITHVTNITEIENVTRVVNQQRVAAPTAGTVAGRQLAFAANPRAVTSLPVQALQAHQHVAEHAVPVAMTAAPGMPHPPAQAMAMAQAEGHPPVVQQVPPPQLHPMPQSTSHAQAVNPAAPGLAPMPRRMPDHEPPHEPPHEPAHPVHAMRDVTPLHAVAPAQPVHPQPPHRAEPPRPAEAPHAHPEHEHREHHERPNEPR